MSRSKSLLLTICLLVMEFRFGTMLYSNLGNENSYAGHIKCSYGLHLNHRLQVPQPCSQNFYL